MDLRSSPTHGEMSKKSSLEQIDQLQSRLLRLQQAIYKHQRRVVLLFEGADAAGKGGAIRRLTTKLDPRGFRVYPIGPPTEEELSRHYLQRFFRRFPSHGELVVFDRSWYGRVLVERIDRFATEQEWRRAYLEINELEKWLIDDGTIVIKFFLHLSRDEQKQRLIARMQNPDKRWKIGDADLDAYEKFEDYTQAWNDMMSHTDTTACPWQVVAADNKHFARVEVLSRTVDTLGKHLPEYNQQLDPALIKRMKKMFGKEISP
ncbi:MAG: UDP-galactose-lipid carrier transferase [Halioglobus sp.]